MERREAIAKVALLLGGSIIGADAFCRETGKITNQNTVLFTKEDERLLDEIGGTILPPIPGSPGAKSAAIGAFMVMMVTNCYEDNQQKIFIDGLNKIRDNFISITGRSFIESDHPTRLNFLQKIDEEQKKQNPGGGNNRRGGGTQTEAGSQIHYFSLMKQLTLLGFFTSEVGVTKALRYVETPGAYRGCIPYKKGDKAWATS